MENKAKDKAVCMNRQSKGYFFTTMVHGDYSKVARRTEQSPQNTAKASAWHQMAAQNSKQETLPSHRNRITVNNNKEEDGKKMETARAHTTATSRLSSK